MNEEETAASREKMLADQPERLRDGRRIAKPGCKGQWLHAEGARISRIEPRADSSVQIGIDFRQASGWWQQDGAHREELPDGLAYLGCEFAPPEGGHGYFSGTLWAFWTWMNEKTPVDVYAAEGAWTLILAPSLPYRFGTMRSAFFPTIMPPESPLNPPAPEAAEADRRAFGEWLKANSMVAVTLGIADEAGGTSYVRQWAVPRGRADDFAGMMTHRFGTPAEMVVDLDAARENAEKEILMIGFCDGDED